MPFHDEEPPATPLVAPRERRVALVIGNAAYTNAPLRNPRNDAEAFAARLREVEPAFDVTVALDVGRDAMENALEAFETKLANCDNALLFFAGHGLQVKGINFLMPVDADIRQEIHLKRRAFALDEVLDIMGRRVRSSSIVLLDACRDNPFARSLVAGLSDEERGRYLTRSGLAEVRAGTGSFIAFATAPDNVALDGTGTNSPFTSALIHHMTTPNTSINDVMIAVRRDVLKATGGRQEPWDQSSLRERFSFHTVVKAIPPPITPIEAPALSEATIFEKGALEHWAAVKDTTDPARLREFLAEYGTSRMGPLAKEVVQRLATEAWRNIDKRDEKALAKFMEVFAGAEEIAHANAALNVLRAPQNNVAPTKASLAQSGAKKIFYLACSAAALAVCIGGAVWLQWRQSLVPDSLSASGRVMVEEKSANTAKETEVRSEVRSPGRKEQEAEFSELARSGSREALLAFASKNPTFKFQVEVELASRAAAEEAAQFASRGAADATRRQAEAARASAKPEAKPKQEHHQSVAWIESGGSLVVMTDTSQASLCAGIWFQVEGTGIVCRDPAKANMREFRDCRGGFCGPVMVVLPTGSITRGSVGWDDDEKPLREVKLRYHISVGKFEVTFDEWDACVDDGGCKHKPETEWGRGRQPVMNVSWTDVSKEYLPWLNRKLNLRGKKAYRLLTEAEWEYAARGVVSASAPHTLYNVGDTITKNQAQFKESDAEQSVEVGRFPPNAFGLHDMHGNVWEWVQDCYSGSYNGVPIDGSAASETSNCARVMRGGAWGSDAKTIRLANRARGSSDSRADVFGFRIARIVSF